MRCSNAKQLLLLHPREPPILSYSGGPEENPIKQAIYIILAALKACSRLGELHIGTQIHSFAARNAGTLDLNVANSLIHMYAKCENLQDARRVFESIPHRSIISWNAAMFGFAENGAAGLALEFFQRMQDEGYVPNWLSYVAALKACSLCAEEDGKKEFFLHRGREIHRQAEKKLLSFELTLENTLVHMYQKCGSLAEARALFDRMDLRDEVTWNALIFGYLEIGDGEEALRLFSRMQDEFRIEPNAQTYIGAVKACVLGVSNEEGSEEKWLSRGAEIHSRISNSEHEWDIKVASALVDMYSKCGSLEDASRVFNGMKNRDIIAWNSIITGYAQSERGEIALELFSRMQEEGMTPNSRTIVAALQACGDIAVKLEMKRGWCLEKGREIHAQIITSGAGIDLFVANMLMNMYGKCGSLREACEVSGRMPAHDLVMLNVMLFNYAESGDEDAALGLFAEMKERGASPNAQSFIAILKACVSSAGKEEWSKLGDGKLVKLSCLEIAAPIHEELVSSGLGDDLKVASTLVDFYAKAGCMEKALEVFHGMKHRDVVCWNAIITGYVQSDEGELGLMMFARMLEDGVTPDGLSYVAALKACSSAAGKEEVQGGSSLKPRSLKIGGAIHLETRLSGYELDSKVANTILDMYSKCGSMIDARTLFERINGDTVSRNTMILGYALNGEPELALEFFANLLEEGLTPNDVTLVSVLKACSYLGSLSTGKMIYREFLDGGIVQDSNTMANSLIAFYGRCGSMSDAQQVFDSIENKQLVTWNSLVAGYSHQGDTEQVFRLVDSMREVTRLQPDSVTFLCILHACSHAGLVEKGRSYFQMMLSARIPPKMEHYSCMIDLLGRANRLDEAMGLLRSMSCKPSFTIWRTLLAAARKWKNLELGRVAFQEMLKLERRNGASYVLMANIYAAAGMFEESNRVHEMSKRFGALRRPGESWWSDESGRIHRFTAGDCRHRQSGEIEKVLGDLLVRMKSAGYSPDLSAVLHDLEDDEKESALCGHSERLAIGCALLNSPPRSTIRIVKSLRICDDCHSAIGFISTIEARVVVCRDVSRFHVFKDGKCSCGDFW